MGKRRKNKKMEPLKYKLHRFVLAALGPIIYLAIAFLPWAGSEVSLPEASKLFSFAGLSKLEFPKFPKVKWPSFSSKQKSAQIGSLTLRLDTKQVRLDQSSGYESTDIKFANFSLHWDADKPLVLLMADGSEQKLLPSSYQVFDDAIALDFEASGALETKLQLFFYPKAGEGAQENLKLELAWLGTQDLPAAIRLPWGAEGLPIAVEDGQLITSAPEAAMQFAAMGIADIEVTGEQYIEILLHHYAFIEHSETKQHLQQEDARIISLLFQNPKGTTPTTAYQKLQAYYRTRLFNQLQKDAQELQSPEAAALYLEMLLESSPANAQENPQETPQATYQGAYEQVRLLAQQNSWSSLDLAPFIGINQNALEENIRQETARINQVRAQYLGSNWSFVGEEETANLVFDYGDLSLLLGLTQRAVIMKQQARDQELFYLNYFLWNLSKIYPRNPYIQLATARAALLAQLQELNLAWQQGLPDGLSMRFALDVLKASWSFPEIQASELATKLFQVMDRDGQLPESYNQTQGNLIPFYEAWPILTAPSLSPIHPKNTTVVPGFWVWTAGSPEVFFESGQPISVTSSNFSQGNKLLLLRGVYFYPQEITVDGQTISPTGQIPVPELGKQASWFYSPEGRYLVIDTAASEQSSSQIIIR